MSGSTEQLVMVKGRVVSGEPPRPRGFPCNFPDCNFRAEDAIDLGVHMDDEHMSVFDGEPDLAALVDEPETLTAEPDDEGVFTVTSMDGDEEQPA